MRTGTPYYQATAATNVIVSNKPAILHGIIIGADVASSTIEISDSVDDGNGNIVVSLAGSTLMTSLGGYVPINSAFTKGIAVDIANQTKVTFCWSPS